MKGFNCCITILLFLLLDCNLYAETLTGPYKLFPLPVSEMEQIIMPWFKSSGFDVSSEPLNMNQILIYAAREEAKWKILLKPHSPLATEIWIESDTDQKSGVTQFNELWRFLYSYIASLVSTSSSQSQSVPTAITSLGQTIVCIKAKRNDDEVQISGFFADKQGLIISTAHDLTEFHKIKVLLRDGQEFDAIIIKINLDKDLALLHINYTPDSYISLLEGRNNLESGERLFSISCLDNLAGNITSGTTIAPPVSVNNQLLWTINMETPHGSSGSPVIDKKGSLVGVVKGRYRGSDTVGFLIPFETIIEFLNGT